jgi:hypothetical protein
MPFAQGHVAHRFRTEQGERWIVLHKPDFGEVTTWELFAKRNHERSMALTTEREKEKRSALLGALKGFLNATEFVQPDPDDTKHYLLFACVSQSNPWMRSLEDVLSSVEMYMTVTGAITCPVLTHMGITRVAGCRNPTKGLAVRFHALTAWALTRGTLRDRAVRPKYMLTAPLSYMGELLGKVGGKDLKFSKTGQGWGQTIKAVLPDETTLTCSTLVLPWLTKLAFTHDKPMIIEYAELAKLADPL